MKYTEKIQCLLTEEDCRELDFYKAQSGMSYNAIFEFAINHFIENKLSYKSKDDSRCKNYGGGKKTKAKKPYITMQTYEKLKGLYEDNREQKMTYSAVAYQAVMHYIRNVKTP